MLLISNDDDKSGNPFVRGFRSTVGREASAFGFSIMITATFGTVQMQHGSPQEWDLILFAVGAVLSFTLLEGVLSRGFREAMPQHKSEVVALGTGLNIISVVGGVASAIGLTHLLETDVAWALCPFAAGLVYLTLESLEIILGERVQAARGDPDATRVEK